MYLLTLFIVLRRSSHLEDKRAAADMEDLAGTGRAGSSSSLYERLEWLVEHLSDTERCPSKRTLLVFC